LRHVEENRDTPHIFEVEVQGARFQVNPGLTPSREGAKKFRFKKNSCSYVFTLSALAS